LTLLLQRRDMKAYSGDAPSYDAKQVPAVLDYRRPRSVDGRASRHTNDRNGRRQRAMPVPDQSARRHPGSSAPAVAERRHRPQRPPVVSRDRRVHAECPPPDYHSGGCAAAAQQGNYDHPGGAGGVFVVPSSPVNLPPSTRLDRIISTTDDSHPPAPPPPNDDQSDRLTCTDTPTMDDDERRTTTVCDVILRRRAIVAAVVYICAFLSPIVMVAIPRPSTVDEAGLSRRRYQCDENCESAFLSLSVRLIVIAVGSLAVFIGCWPRRLWSAAELPRVDDVEATLTGLVLLVSVVFWCFYAVRVAGPDDVHVQYTDYGRTVSFAGSMADTLLFVHGLAALVLGLRCRRSSTDFVVHVLCSPDGRSTTFSVSSMSVQRLALLCLRRCCVGFESEKSGTCILRHFTPFV